MGQSKQDFFTYKGFPLVRNKDIIYYGNMSDDYVVMMQVLDTKKVGDLEVADKIKVFKISTDESIDLPERITKASEKNGLYEALDIAYVWLSRS